MLNSIFPESVNGGVGTVTLPTLMICLMVAVILGVLTSLVFSFKTVLFQFEHVAVIKFLFLVTVIVIPFPKLFQPLLPAPPGIVPFIPLPLVNNICWSGNI